MDRDTARQEIRNSWKRLFPADHKGQGIICPLCGSGSGKNGTGITENPQKPGQLKCWNCEFQGDVLDLIQRQYGTDYNGALKMAADQLGITIDPYRQENAGYDINNLELDDLKTLYKTSAQEKDKERQAARDKEAAAALEQYRKEQQEAARSAPDQTEYDPYKAQMEQDEIICNAVNRAFIYWHNGQELPGMLKKFLCNNTDYEYADSIQEFYRDYGLLNKDGTISEYGQATIEAEKDTLQATQNAAEPAEDKEPAESMKTPENAAGTPTGATTEDYTTYYETCRRNLSNPAAVSYLQARGISTDTATAYGLGFDPAWISPTVIKNQKAKGNDWTPKPTARIIMPVSKNHYIARAISPDVKKDFSKMNETGGGKIGIFNAAAVYGDKEAVFVTEGIFDALSIIECGGAALALNSTSNADLFIKQLEKDATRATLVLCLDNDDAGKKAAAVIKQGLTRLNISYVTADIAGRFNDPNEALTGDRAAFEKAIQDAEAQTAAKPDNINAYIDNLMYGEIERLKAAADRKTGFKTLDEKSGGLYPGLYVIAATSSLGKTTFALQIADNLAAAGHEVLFFSMEQSRLELVTKSFSRLLAENTDEPANSLSLRKGYQPDKLRKAAAIYKEKIGDRLSIIEGNFNCNISFIGDYIRRYIRRNNSSPVVIVDYLQILQPADDARTMSLKETVDNTVTELKRISREHDLTVFVVSSVNRANYMTPIDFEALKESGGIEYTADVIWGLQLECLNDPLFDTANKIKEKRERIRQEKRADPRKIELVCLKNRYGVANFICGFWYYPAKDLFVNVTENEFMAYYGKLPFDDAGQGNEAGNGQEITARF